MSQRLCLKPGKKKKIKSIIDLLMKTFLINAKAWLGKNNFMEAIGFDSSTGEIFFLGSNHDAKEIKNKSDEVVDVKKRLVIPAFTDGHCHFIKGALVNSQLNLRTAKTKADFENGIKKYKRDKKKGWIYGGYFSDTNFKEDILLNSRILDEICEDVPLVISKFDMHSAFANTKAFELSGILEKENDFTPEELIKDKNGPTGELKERAMNFVTNHIPAASIKERTDIALQQLAKLHSLGIVAFSDITLAEDLEIYKQIIKQEKLLLRIDARLPFTEFENIEKYKIEFDKLTNNIKFKSFKAFYDGSLSSKTAYMHENYKNTDHNGIRTEYVNSGEFFEAAFEIDKAGFQASVHAIGDKAVTELLDFNEELILKNGRRDRRFRIEHAQHIREKDFQRFKVLNVIASVQPSHLFSDAKTSSEILEDHIMEHNYKKLFDIGARVCFGTDFPVVSESPFETIYYAMTRKAEAFEEGFVPENRIALTDCLEAYTIENAYATYDEKLRGNLEVGKLADIAVLENNIFEMRPEEILNAKVSMTYFNGERVF